VTHKVNLMRALTRLYKRAT